MGRGPAAVVAARPATGSSGGVVRLGVVAPHAVVAWCGSVAAPLVGQEKCWWPTGCGCARIGGLVPNWAACCGGGCGVPAFGGAAKEPVDSTMTWTWTCGCGCGVKATRATDCGEAWLPVGAPGGVPWGQAKISGLLLLSSASPGCVPAPGGAGTGCWPPRVLPGGGLPRGAGCWPPSASHTRLFSLSLLRALSPINISMLSTFCFNAFMSPPCFSCTLPRMDSK
mmetsp:Transcript_46712/g.123388  ORF Transcript_46712/g.123388 Transcript_46712/m.123388 type:complete len:225 (+) Transcript_46712:220-894(+)